MAILRPATFRTNDAGRAVVHRLASGADSSSFHNPNVCNGVSHGVGVGSVDQLGRHQGGGRIGVGIGPSIIV
jgi:hypothetical protein